MKTRISLRLPYRDDNVGCFDPERVLVRLLASFPEAEVDPKDWSAAEVEQVENSLAASDSPDDVKESVRRQIQGKARRNGPAYHFRLSLPSGDEIGGMVNRYTVTLQGEEGLSAIDRGLLTDFLTSLNLGAPRLEEDSARG